MVTVIGKGRERSVVSRGLEGFVLLEEGCG